MSGALKRVLIVDDEAEIGKLLECFLENHFDCEIFTDAEKALEYLGSHEIDVILSDLRMPKLNGIEFLNQAHKLQPNSRKFIVSGAAIDLAGINPEMDVKIITKPFTDPAQIINILKAG